MTQRNADGSIAGLSFTDDLKVRTQAQAASHVTDAFERTPAVPTSIDVVHMMMAYETEGLNEDDLVVFFQYLIDTGLAWSLQGTYGRQAQTMIDLGVCEDPR
jgi:hypothetical protein